jgi:uncharacterized protein
MDVFGEHWRHHAERIREHWLQTVAPEDTVLIPGDISWAMRFEEAVPDLEWIDALPGTKVLIRGNHDYWWSSKKSAAKLRGLMPPSLIPLHKTSHVAQVDGRRVGIIGTRGWQLPPVSAHDEEIVENEGTRLSASIASLPEVDEVVAMIHFPPFTPDLGETAFSTLMRDAGARVVLFGHVHLGKGGYFEGERDGVLYRNVAADQVRFRPQRIL